MENWALFLKEADNPKKKDVIQKLTDKEAGLMNATKSLKSISEDRDLWIAQYRQEIYERDKLSSLNAAINKGLQQGIQQGMMEEKYKNAMNFLKMGISPEQVANGVGLPLSEILALKGN